MPLPDYVRVRLQNGSHASILRRAAQAAGLKPLKQEALGRDGRPRPPKHRVPLGGAGSAATSNTEAADASESKED